MKQRAKAFFYGILAVSAFALILAACPTNTSSNPADNTPRLKLSGKVYTQDIDPQTYKVTTSPYNDSLSISDRGMGGAGEIKKGQLDYTIIGEPLNLSSINEGGGLDYLKDMYPTLKFSPEDAKAAVAVLEITDSEEYGGLLKGLLDIKMLAFPPNASIKTVNYVYVDRRMQITADLYEYHTDDYGLPMVLTSEKINLNLKKGWNALYSEITARLDMTTSNLRGNLKMSVSDPADLKWTLVSSEYLGIDPVEPEYPEPPEPPDFE